MIKNLKAKYRTYKARKLGRKARYIKKYIKFFDRKDLNGDIDYLGGNPIEVRPNGEEEEAKLRVYNSSGRYTDSKIRIRKYRPGDWEKELNKAYREAKKIVQERRKKSKRNKKKAKYRKLGLNQGEDE